MQPVHRDVVQLVRRYVPPWRSFVDADDAGANRVAGTAGALATTASGPAGPMNLAAGPQATESPGLSRENPLRDRHLADLEADCDLLQLHGALEGQPQGVKVFTQPLPLH